MSNQIHTVDSKSLWKVIGASSLGTLIEWYDFYIFGSLAPIIATQFFPKTNPTAALLSTLATFAAGFIVRPFGALVFGRLGDLIGRKYTFLLTLVLMGGATFLIGCVPKYETIGFAAPLIILLLRLLQGLALGGEYGGAATYVAEFSPANRRGYFTSWIQTTATLGLFISLGVILIVRKNLHSDPAESIKMFSDWGWRIPFLISILLVIVSIYIRLKMAESPLFSKLKKEGKTSSNPLKESFGHRANLKMVLLALFGATMGQGVVWYTGQFYAQSFIENVCKVDFEQSRKILIWAIVFATPFFVVFGSWSDKIGRKWIMMIGMVLAVLLYTTLFNILKDTTDPKVNKTLIAQTIDSTKTLIANSQDTLRKVVTKTVHIDGIALTEKLDSAALKQMAGMKTTTTLVDTVYASGKAQAKPSKPTITRVISDGQYWKMVGIVFFMILLVTMVYGPIAAFLVEMFPTKIRYTSMSLPYHIGNGVFGGLTPFVATLLTTIYVSADQIPEGLRSLGFNTGNIGLAYPILIAVVCAVIGIFYISNKRVDDVRS